MNIGETFTHNGQTYEAIHSGIEYKERNKTNCIRPSGKSRCITIRQALNEGLIKATTIASGPVPNLFDNDQDSSIDQRHENISVKRQISSSSGLKDTDGFYLPVDQLRAQVYLAHGLIYPQIYERKGVASDFADLQMQSPTELTILESPCFLKDNQLNLRILLNPGEISDARKDAGYLYLSQPLPISRLVGIEIPESAGDLNRYIDGWIKPDVPVPNHLFKVANSMPYVEESRNSSNSSNLKRSPIPEIADSILKFDKYLGTMAFLRNADRYFSERTGYYADYPDVFFELGEGLLTNRSEMRDLSDIYYFLLALLDFQVQLSPAASQLLAIVRSDSPYIEKENARQLALDIHRNSNQSDILAQAFRTLFNGDYRNAVKELQKQNLPPEAAILAVLYKFSGRQTNDHRTIKQRLHEDWESPTQVYQILGALGAFYGYTALDACETNLYSVHSTFQNIINSKPEIKFHLRSAVERRMIESLYNKALYSWDSKIDNSIDYDIVSPAISSQTTKIENKFIQDSSYSVHGLWVNRYEVLSVGILSSLLGQLNKEHIDQQSEVGRYLMSECINYADEFEYLRKADRYSIRYKIKSSKLFNLLAQGKIKYDFEILKLAIQKDRRGDK